MLPSQFARSKSSRAHMYRRTRLRRAPFVIAAVVVFVLTFFAFRFWPGKNHSTLETAAAAPSNQPAPVVHENPNIEMGVMGASREKPTHEQKPTSPAAKTSSTSEKPATVARGAASSEGAAKPQPPAAPTTPPASPPQAATPPAATPENQGSMLAAAPVTAPLNSASTPSGKTPGNTPGNSAGNTSPSHPSQRMSTGLDLLARNKPIEARKMLTDVLTTEKLAAADADKIRQTLSTLNQKLVFGQDVLAGDPLARSYAVESGDVLVRLPKKLDLKADYRLIQRINNLSNEKLRLGQKLKILSGPFHAMVVKSEFRMDIYEGPWDQRVYVCSFPVGLGEYGATPEGVFAVRPGSKLINPTWVNPRTGQKFSADDPLNPIGERWIGLVGTSDNIRDLAGYGIHGTIDPDSIGKQKSMGCVRMHSEDVEVVYELLMEGVSRIEIHGEDYP